MEMQIKIVYITNHPSQQRANKKYRENNKELIKERARTLYNENIEYNKRRKEQMRDYARKRREQLKLNRNEELFKSIGNL
jgi:hypothetical protein